MAMDNTQVDVRMWLSRVLAWDGLLPVCIALLPPILAMLVPDLVVTIAGVVVPLAALFIRAKFGPRHIASNRVHPFFRNCQYAVFAFGIGLLCFIDVFIFVLITPPFYSKRKASGLCCC
jgi:hypothetical protein